MEIKSAAFVVRHRENVWEGLRSAAGLGMENVAVSVFLLAELLEEDLGELLEMLEDLEGQVYTVSVMDARRYGSLRRLEVRTMAGLIKACDLVVGF
ncbi:MAG: hypothetical protein AB1896_13930 [Thermodesulfobacteriota bacterium]